MEVFVPSWTVLDKRKICWGLGLILYSMWRLSKGDSRPFTLLMKGFSGVVFTLIVSSGIGLLLKREVAKIHYTKLLLVSAGAYIYVITTLVGV